MDMVWYSAPEQRAMKSYRPFRFIRRRCRAVQPGAYDMNSMRYSVVSNRVLCIVIYVCLCVCEVQVCIRVCVYVRSGLADGHAYIHWVLAFI